MPTRGVVIVVYLLNHCHLLCDAVELAPGCSRHESRSLPSMGSGVSRGGVDSLIEVATAVMSNIAADVRAEVEPPGHKVFAERPPS